MIDSQGHLVEKILKIGTNVGRVAREMTHMCRGRVRHDPLDRMQDSVPMEERHSSSLPGLPGAGCPALGPHRPIYHILLHLHCVQLRALPVLHPSPQHSGC